MSAILHVQDEASVEKTECSDYQEIKYVAISVSASTPQIIG